MTKDKVEPASISEIIDQTRSLAETLADCGGNPTGFCHNLAGTVSDLAFAHLKTIGRFDQYGQFIGCNDESTEPIANLLLTLKRDAGAYSGRYRPERFEMVEGPKTEPPKPEQFSRIAVRLSQLTEPTVNPSPDVSAVQATYSPNEMRRELGCSDKRLRDYAKAAGVKNLPTKKGDRYSAADRTLTYRHVADGGASDSHIVANAKRLLEEAKPEVFPNSRILPEAI